jgi:hypothetical protein
MRALLSLLMVCLIASPALAVDKVLIGGDDSHGGYGGLVFKYSKVNGDYKTFVGAKGGWVINHVFVVGLAGYGLIDEYDNDWWHCDSDSDLHMGYGGLMLEYIVHPHRLVHLSTSLLIGGGSYGYGSNWLDYDSRVRQNPCGSAIGRFQEICPTQKNMSFALFIPCSNKLGQATHTTASLWRQIQTCLSDHRESASNLSLTNGDFSVQ